MDRVKNRGRNKYLACFSPVLDADDATERSVRRNKRPRRSFASAVKAVFAKTTLGKSLSRKKSWKDSFRSNSVKSKKNSSFSDRDESLSRSNSDPSSIFSQSIVDSSRSSSGSLSISSSISGLGSEVKTHNPSDHLQQTIPITYRQQFSAKLRADRKLENHKVGLCIFLVCLLALVFWGKVFAIVTCTSTWLFFAPARKHRRPESLDLASIYDSEDYKKRVIMEGLLERSHSIAVF